MNSKKKENQFVSLLFNIVVPVLIMTKMSGTEGAFALGPQLSLILAVSFPLGYGIYHFVKVRKVNFISALGFVSVLLTGVMGLFTNISPFWFAVKEASIPFIIALVLFVSMYFKQNLVSKFLFNEELMRMDLVYSKLEENNKLNEFNHLLHSMTYWVIFSFLLSSVLNFVLARIILQSEPGTSAYIEEIGKMNAISFPVIALPSTIILVVILMYVFKKIKLFTNLGIEEIISK